LKKVIYLLILAFSFEFAFSQVWMNNIDEDKADNFYEVQEKFNQYWKDKEQRRGTGWKQYKRWEYFWEQRLYPSGEMPNGVELYKNLENYMNTKSPSFLENESEWSEVGPVNIPENWLSYMSSGLGRLNNVTIHPENKDEIWVGASNGGAWFTKDGGETWNVVDISGVMSIGISDIAISESEPNIIYLATGDQNGSQMTRGFSVGILKSTDGGETWEQTGYTKTKNNGVLISRILINPKNPDIVIAGANQGIITTVNGGTDWFESYSGRFVRDMEFHTTNNNIIYASTGDYSGSAILKSADGGSTFEVIETIGSANRLEIAVSKAAPKNVYVLASSRSTNGYEGFYKSVDEGETWTKQSNSPNILGIDANGQSDGGQGFYDLALAVSDVNPDMVFIGGIHIWKSNNSGKNWSLVNHWTGSGGKPFVHADQHWLQFDGTRLYSANDGGIFYSDNLGSSWTDISNGLSIAQFYKIDVYEGYEEIIMGGTQDNGTHMANEGEWYHVHGGDGMDCKINPENPEIMYATTYYGNLNLSTNGGQSFRYILGPYTVQENGGWVTPYELDTENPNILYIGYVNVFKLNLDQGSINRLTNLSGSVINALRVSKTNNNYIYFAKNNVLYRTTDGGDNWQNIYTAQKTISDIAISTDDPKNCWISLSGYTNGTKVYEIIDGDAKNISGDLPNYPASAIIEQANAPGTLFLGTDIGVFRKKSFSNEWVLLDNNLPKVVITDLEINYPKGYLYAGTFGRGIWKTQIINCDIAKPEITLTGETEFCMGDSLIIRKKGDYENFVWSTGAKEDSIIVTQTGNYYLIVQDSSGCSAISERIDVNVKYVPPLVVNIPNNGRLCAGDTLTLGANFGFSAYEWSTGDTTRSIEIWEPGDYYVTAFTSEGCSVTYSDITINIFPKPEKPSITKKNDTLYTDEAYAHRWFKDGKFIPGNNQNKLHIEEIGFYEVEIINEFGCAERSDTFEVITSINEISNIDYQIMPNPTEGQFSVRFNNGVVKSLFITNQLGQKIFEINNNTDTYIEIDLSEYPNGVYFINFMYNNSRKIEKIIKN
jgi:photosystem II stability/assembly factor-like uncharacterized protein